ncbi:MAG: M23 family metallopeptidase [Vicinamibacterales bacterium]
MRAFLVGIVIVILLGAGWFFGFREGPPSVTIVSPADRLGLAGELDVLVATPGSLDRLDVRLEQSGQQFPLFSLPGDADSTLTQEGAGQVRLKRAISARALPQLKSGPARIVAHVERRVLFGLRVLEGDAARDLTVSLEPPRVSVLSTHHYINHGGSEMVVYRATPADVESGVRVGDVEYPGFPAAGAGIPATDPALRVAFFALLYDQDLATPIEVFARDAVGNEAKSAFDFRVFPKPFRKSTIPIDDRFLSRVVPAILQETPDAGVADPANLELAFLAINGDLRRRNAESIAAYAAKTNPALLWKGPFRQMTNSQVESAFADQRTYVYGGREIDRQVHLGYDLAVTSNVEVKAANAGVVIHASYLGIYGNCVIVDHGMGVQSLYAHLSSLAVKPGDRVERDQTLGRSGMTGLAGGDHLHFTMLVNGRMVTPVDWWSTQWVEDRILRKLREAGATATPEASAAATTKP